MKPRIVPTVFAHSKKEFDERLARLVPVAHDLQIDLMDGKFVSGRSIDLKAIPNLDCFDNTFEAHLMVADPEQWIAPLAAKGFDRIIFHIETQRDARQARATIAAIRAAHLEPMVAINPETPLPRLEAIIDQVNGVLCMGGLPGKEHQQLSPSALRKIRALRRKYPRLRIQVDIGVSNKTIRRIARAGADSFNSGSFVGQSLDPASAIRALRREAQKGWEERDTQGGLS